MSAAAAIQTLKSGASPVPGSVSYALFKHMNDEHGLTLIGSELSEIVRVVNGSLEERLRWWINNASEIAKERADLFRAGEAMRAAYVTHIGTDKSGRVNQWDAAAKPMHDMFEKRAATAAPRDPDHQLTQPMDNQEAVLIREIAALRIENEQLKIKLSRMCGNA